MELPSIGKHCATSNCQQLDFLPLQCKCGKVFCSEHFKIHVETCEKSKYLSEEELRRIENVFVCSHVDCKERSIVPLICERCKKHFCVKHRHLTECEDKDPEILAAEREKYAAPVRQFNEAKAIIDKQLENNLLEAKKKAKNKDMAIKVQLMRIKNKATGAKSIPTANRVYFHVTHPKPQSEKTTAVFVSDQWTVGRVIDAIAQELRLENNNNKSSEKKLRLFKKEDKEIISKNVSIGLGVLLKENNIVNGESLIIEYVDEDCVQLM